MLAETTKVVASTCRKAKAQHLSKLGFSIRRLAVTYFRKRSAYYHWRGFVSRSCSEWEGVVPNRYGRQT
jgi:hypothetical protein